MTDTEILKRIEDRLEVAMENYKLTGADGDRPSTWIIFGLQEYIRKCRELQKNLGISNHRG